MLKSISLAKIKHEILLAHLPFDPGGPTIDNPCSPLFQTIIKKHQ